MRITHYMDVTGGSSRTRRHVHKPDALESLDAARFAKLDLRVAGVLQEWREPAAFVGRAAPDPGIGAAQVYDQALTGGGGGGKLRGGGHRQHSRFFFAPPARDSSKGRD